jgi:hypothetical protein
VYDSWLDDGFHFFVFQLAPQPGSASSAGLAVFAMHADERDPVSAVTVVPTDTGSHAAVTDLRDPANSYIAPLPGASGNGPMRPAPTEL